MEAFSLLCCRRKLMLKQPVLNLSDCIARRVTPGAMSILVVNSGSSFQKVVGRKLPLYIIHIFLRKERVLKNITCFLLRYLVK